MLVKAVLYIKFHLTVCLFVCVCVQIFFHYSELSKNAESELEIGSSVEFIIQNRQVGVLIRCVGVAIGLWRM